MPVAAHPGHPAFCAIGSEFNFAMNYIVIETRRHDYVCKAPGTGVLGDSSCQDDPVIPEVFSSLHVAESVAERMSVDSDSFASLWKAEPIPDMATGWHILNLRGLEGLQHRLQDVHGMEGPLVNREAIDVTAEKLTSSPP